MSFPSAKEIMQKRGLSLDALQEDQAREILLEAYKKDVPLGFNRIKRLVEKVKKTGSAVLDRCDPNSEEGKQVARLMGPDIQREILSAHFGVDFQFYNCCVTNVLPKGSTSSISAVTQI